MDADHVFEGGVAMSEEILGSALIELEMYEIKKCMDKIRVKAMKAGRAPTLWIFNIRAETRELPETT